MRRRVVGSLLAAAFAALSLPAVASACTTFTTTYSGASGGDWATATNWTPNGVPGSGAIVCIPAGTDVVITTPEAVADLNIDPHSGTTPAGQLAINGGSLTVGAGTGSTISGPVSLDGGALEINTPATVGQDGSLSAFNGAMVTIDPARTLTLANSADVVVPSPPATIQNNGTLALAGGTGADPTNVAAFMNGDGVFTNSGQVVLTGGASGAGPWNLGSGSGVDEPSVTLGGPGTYSIDGTVDDSASGGQGHLIINDTTYTATSANAQIHVYELDMIDLASTMDFSTSNSPTSMIDVQYLYVNNGFFEVDTALNAGTINQRSGVMLNNGPWTASVFRWGGGELQSASAGSGTLTVSILDMNPDVFDSGVRVANGTDLTVNTGSGTGPYASGSFDLRGSTFTLGPDARFVIGGDVDITQTNGSGKIVNHGVIEKSLGSLSTIVPQIDMTDGELDVTTTGELALVQAPIGYDVPPAMSLTSGIYRLTGTLAFPGPVTTSAATLEFNGGNAHLVDTSPSGADALTTLADNSGTLSLTGTTLTLATSGFTNGGQVTLGSSGVMTLAGDYLQNTGIAGTTMTTVDSGIDLGTNTFQLQGGSLNGLGTITGNLTSDAVVAPGTPTGEMFVTLDFTQHATGSLVVDIGGAAAFSALGVGGLATLDGALVVNQIGGYHAPGGQAYDVMSWGSRAVGTTFASITQPADYPFYETAYDAGFPSLRLTANGVSIGNAAVTEGGSGTTNATFTISMAHAAPAVASVDWATQDGSATAGSDYTASSGTVTFQPGETTKTVSVPVIGDTAVEPDETFRVALSKPSGTAVIGGAGTGTITNDDQPVAVPSGPSGPSGPTGPTVPAGDIDGQASAPPPVQGKAVNVEPVKGTILVKLPGTTKFVVLPDREQIPTGSIVDARKGTVRLFSEASKGRQQFANFFEGMFQIAQKPGQALTQAKLVGGNFKKACGKAGHTGLAQAAAKRKKAKSVQHLWGEGSGQFRTAGRFASATVRGTKWLTDDRCDGTLVRVTKGAVTVKDLTLKKTFALKAPKTYLAPAVKPKKKRG